MAFVLAAATFAVTAGAAVANYAGQQQAAGKANAAGRAQAERDRLFRQDMMAYQNDVWAQDLAYAREVLEYSEGEFARQTDWAELAMERAQQNRDSDAYTLMVRGIEERIAATFQNTSMARQGRAARAQFSARDRGVEGNSVEAVLGDVQRQEGDARLMTEMNFDATRRQLGREGRALDAAADQTAYQIASSIRTFAPNAPVRAPQPLPASGQPQQVNGPSPISLVAGIGQAAAGAFNSYSQFSGQTNAQTWNQLSTWAGRQFQIGGP
jgi:hypothetical protein